MIQQPFNQGNILIDTGGLRNKDLASLTLVPYLRSQGILNWTMSLYLMMILIISGAYESLSNQIEIKAHCKKYQEKMKIGNIEIEMLKK